VGHVPNGNRTYYLSRSQPPFLAAMVGLYARAADSTQALRYLGALEAEHAFWMEGASRLAPGTAHRRVVRLRDGALLNRYWDDRPEPRPESYREDFRLAERVPAARRESLYRDLRAAAESGWDFSSRWMRDSSDLATLETTQIAPVDLNSLLYDAERTIAALRAFRGAAGDAAASRRFADAAEARRRALLAAAYDPAGGYFFDVRWRTGERVSTGPPSPPRRRSTSGSPRRSRGAPSPRGSGATSSARAASSRRSSRRDSSGTRRMAGRRSSGSRPRACGATAAPTSPTPRGRGGSPSTGAPTPRPGR
jgi:alpha,alpha-trehalase